MLHITNGDSVSLRDSGLPGAVMVWLDVLHEGPVPAGLELEELSRLRAAYLDGRWPGQDAAAALARRDDALRRFADHEEVVLWFEHDLYDQLQLIQILDWFHERDLGSTRLRLIVIDRYLGRLTGAELAELWPARRAATPGQLAIATRAWTAFRAPDPVELDALVRDGTPALPLLAGALERHLEQFPSERNGLARTERQILEAVAAGAREFEAIFKADQRREERVFMGDCTFAGYLERLASCRNPLLERSGAGWELMPAGRDVLAGRLDHVRLNGIDRWLGGVHLEGREAAWRWDEPRRRIVFTNG